MTEAQYEMIYARIRKVFRDIKAPMEGAKFEAQLFADSTTTSGRINTLKELIETLHWLSFNASEGASWLNECHLEIAEEEAHEINWEKGYLERPNS